MLFTSGARRILDFDIENRPLAYLGPDFTTAEITAIAASWYGEAKVHVWLLGVDDYKDMLEGFRKLYDKADIVTGHYIRKHDLPVINGALVETGLAPLGSKLTSDTKLDYIRSHYISESQENMAREMGVRASKVNMTNWHWRQANRLTPDGIKFTRQRVIGDVIQHKELRTELLKRGLLGPPKIWKS